MSSVLQCNNVIKTYHEGELEVPVLKGVNIDIAPGEMIAILGQSGSGKSTLLQCMGGLDKPTEGTVYINQQDINLLSEKEKGLCRNQNLGFVYQFHHLLPEFNALENVMMPLLVRGDKKSLACRSAKDLLEKVGLKDRLTHRVSELSGGERQRVAIARALVTNPKCVLADEPTGNLDSKTAASVFDLIFDLNKTLETSFVIVTHDEKLAQAMSKRLQLRDGLLHAI